MHAKTGKYIDKSLPELDIIADRILAFLLIIMLQDVNQDNKVSYEDFQAAVAKDSLLLELLGQCLPSDAVRFSYWIIVCRSFNLDLPFIYCNLLLHNVAYLFPKPDSKISQWTR